jgi:hypothetical protein
MADPPIQQRSAARGMIAGAWRRTLLPWVSTAETPSSTSSASRARVSGSGGRCGWLP